MSTATAPKSDDTNVPSPPCTLVIFGGAGDLTKRLLMPALYNLARQGLLDDKTRIIGVDHAEKTAKVWAADLTETMQSFTGKSASEFHVDKIDTKAWSFITSRLDYRQGDFLSDDTYTNLGDAIEGNAIFYFAVSQRFFAPIAENLGKAGLLKETRNQFRRVVVEKPFGSDLKSAQALNASLLSVADETQLFRVDHFLGKETVQGILALRFTNGIFEPLWRREHIDHVQITVAETLGVEARGGFYDGTGALRDMVPNHLFQLICMAAMEPPNSFSAEAVRNAKQQLLEAIAPVTGKNAVRGQYTAGNGQTDYRQADHVDRASRTETFVALKLNIANWRWHDVPFYLRTGKAMSNRLSEIAIVFKPAPSLPFRGQPDEQLTPNVIRFQITPQHGMQISFNAKVPGPDMRLGVVSSTFDDDAYFPNQSGVGYETLLYDCMRGDATLFQRADNIEASWTVVDKILKAWHRGEPEFYAAGSSGPDGADALLERDGRAWLPLSLASKPKNAT